MDFALCLGTVPLIQNDFLLLVCLFVYLSHAVVGSS